MITKYTSGTPIRTDAVVKDFAGIDINKFPIDYKIIDGKFIFNFDMQDSDIVFGLGEAPRGINKRGWIYESFCSDDPFHTETKSSLYAAHNFLMLNGSKTFGIFIDFPAKIRWDIGYTKQSRTEITVDGTDFDIYIIENESNKPIDIVKEFRSAIGQSYIPPFWAFGYQQSRWSYPDKAAVDGVIKGYNDAKIPLDCVYLDIDYMKDYKDFTVDEDKFPNFAEYVKEKKEQGIHLIPIIDAGVKKEAGYDVYEEGVENPFFEASSFPRGNPHRQAFPPEHGFAVCGIHQANGACFRFRKRVFWHRDKSDVRRNCAEAPQVRSFFALWLRCS